MCILQHVSACYSIFKLSQKDSYQLWRSHCLLAAVCAAKECVQTAQLRKVERVCTCARSEVKHVSGVPIGMHWLAYAHTVLHDLLSE